MLTKNYLQDELYLKTDSMHVHAYIDIQLVLNLQSKHTKMVSLSSCVTWTTLVSVVSIKK